MNRFASLCILAYKRPALLESCVKSIKETINYPCEVIVNYDGLAGSADAEEHRLGGFFSKIILSHGDNRGVGRSFQNCLGMAEGDYIFKIDTDLIFKPGWLTMAIKILENHPDVGAVSLFNYRHYDPKDARFNVLEEREDCLIVDDFVSSVYGFRAEDIFQLKEQGLKEIPDDGLHTDFKRLRGNIAITKEDFVDNQGFGLGRSTYVVPDKDGKPVKAEVHDRPLIFEK